MLIPRATLRSRMRFGSMRLRCGTIRGFGKRGVGSVISVSPVASCGNGFCADTRLGGHAQTFAPFSDEHINLPLLPFPTDLLPGVRDIPELHHQTIQANARSPSEASSPTEHPSNASSTTTASVRRMSPLPSTSPATKATLLGRHAALSGMNDAGPSYATPVTSNADAPPVGHQVGKKAARRPPPPPAVNPKSRGYGR